MLQFAEATDWDREVVARQIGREPRGMIAVSRRCSHGCPQIVVTKPLGIPEASGVLEFFPTMFWLSCPHLCRSVAALESEQWIELFRARVKDDSEFRKRLDRRHRQYALERKSLVDPDDLRTLRETSPHLYKRLVEAGIGGIERAGGIKCLHLHLADYLSGGDNPVGEEVYRRLSASGCFTECSEGTCRQCPETVALLNVGSNSVKLLVARLAETADERHALETLAKRAIVTRLAEGLCSGPGRILPTHRLADDAVERAADATRSLVAEARSHRISRLMAFGTAAARQASNRGDLISVIRDRTGLELSILSEVQEAELSYAGARAALPAGFRNEPVSDYVLVLDIGGASTEAAIGYGNKPSRSASVELGALTVLSRTDDGFDADGRMSEAGLAGLLRCCRQTLDLGLQSILEKDQKVVAVGGSITAAVALLLGLETYDPSAIHGYLIGRNQAYGLLSDICRRTRRERQEMRGMVSRDRADSVIGGLAILVSLMSVAGAEEACVSEHGLLEGVAYSVLRGLWPPQLRDS